MMSFRSMRTPLMRQTRGFCSSAAQSNGPKKIMMATTDCVPGWKVETYCGFVSGATVRSRNVTQDIASIIPTLMGGELSHYSNLMQEARTEAMDRLQENCGKMDANAVLGLRMVSNTVQPGVTEVLAYGTAVKMVKE